MITEIWVDFIQDIYGGFRPDIPVGITRLPNESECAPTDFTDSDSPHAVSKCNILVDDSDIPAIRAHLQGKGSDLALYADGDEQDVLTVDMVRALSGKTGSGISDAMDAFAANRKTADRQKLRDVLTHAVTRGVTSQRADALRIAESLPEADAIIRV